MRKTALVLCLASMLVVAMAPSPASAAEWRVDLDPERTDISFTLKATMHTVHGSAQLASGSLVIDPDTGAIGGEVVVDASSAETGNGSRDKKMHRKVLLSGNHPRIVLRPERLEGALTTGSNITVTLMGDFELLGALHPISIPLDIRIDGTNVAVASEFTVPYVAWGLENPSTFVLRVAKEVNVQVITEGRIQIGARNR